MAKKQGSDQHHQGKLLKYLGKQGGNYTYSIQFEDGTEEIVSGGDIFGDPGDIQVRTKWRKSCVCVCVEV